MEEWLIAAKKADFEEIGNLFSISPVLARIIRNRDLISMEEIRKYLHGDRSDLYAPYLLKDMDKTVEILRQKIAEGKKIRVIGDYDADGICAAYVLCRGLEHCGGKVDTVIPHRQKDGYGLNSGMIETAHEEGIDTIITCDNGIAAGEQALLARALSITLLITDHHEVPFVEETDGSRRFVLPEAAAVVDPKREDCTYPFPGICGATVAYKVIEALMEQQKPEEKEAVLSELLEIAAFATICDVMELRDENRIIVRCGLSAMQNTKNIGLRALIEVCGLEEKPLSAYHIGFVLGPCMNATGRLDTAARALALLRSKDKREAVCLAGELKALNESRKELTLDWTKKAFALIEKEQLSEDLVLVVYLPDCHESLAGIIAGRIREKYGKPAFVLTDGEDGVKGSGRSIEAYGMFDALVECKELLTRFGGHKMAAGLSMEQENVDKLRRQLNIRCKLTKKDFAPKVHIDVALPLSYLTEAFIEELELLAPFGMGNTKPVFAQKNVVVISGKIIGKNQNTGKFVILDEAGNPYEMIYFGDLEKLFACLEEKAGKEAIRSMQQGRRVEIPLSITYYPSINSYGGSKSIQIVLQNFR